MNTWTDIADELTPDQIARLWEAESYGCTNLRQFAQTLAAENLRNRLRPAKFSSDMCHVSSSPSDRRQNQWVSTPLSCINTGHGKPPPPTERGLAAVCC